MARRQFGTSGADYLVGFGIDDPDSVFDDELYGLEGDDTLVLTTRPGWVWGGAGNDYISGGTMSDWLIGEAGDDLIFGGAGNDLLDGGDGADVIQGGFGNDTIFGGLGDDVIYGGGFSATGSAADGDDDIIQAGGGNDIVFGGAGNDIIYGDDSYETWPDAENPSRVVVVRTSGNDSLAGGDGDDWIFGFDGDDAIDGGAGNDVLLGGDGIDFIFDMEGDNLIATGRGADIVMTGDGNDTIYSGGYRDFIAPRPSSSMGAITILGEEPRPTDLFRADTAELYDGVRAGLSGHSRWVSHYGVITIEPSETPILPSGAGDYISSGGGNDIIFGGEFDDTIFDGLGNDYVSSGGGEDTLYLDGGVDVIQLVGTVMKPMLQPTAPAGNAVTVFRPFKNPETLVYGTASAIAEGSVDFIYGFSAEDGDRIHFDDALGTNVAFHDSGAGGTWLTLDGRIFASILGVAPEDVQGAFFYI